MLAEKNCWKNSCFWKLRCLIVAKWALHYVHYLFSEPVIFSSYPFVILCSRYCFAEGIRKNCKELVDLQFVHPKSAQLSRIFLSEPTDTKLVLKLVGNLFTSCSLLSTCFSFSLFLFCLPDMCACAIFRENQNKGKPSSTIHYCHGDHIY